jgi:hypothetical protein
MDKEFIFDIIKFVATVALAIAGWVFAWRNFKRQMNANTVMKYAERYEKIMDSFPKEARGVRFNLDCELPPESEETRLAALKYLNLCSEEYYLCKEGYLAKNVWEIWERELKRTLSSKLFKREWQMLKNEFESDPDFTKFVDEVQSGTPTG